MFRCTAGHFAILAQPAKLWEQDTLKDVWYAFVVMHSMIIEADEDSDNDDDYIEHLASPSLANADIMFDSLLQQLAHVHNESDHLALRDDLVEHL